MKSDIFSEAISNRYKIRFLYSTDIVEMDPYFIGQDRSGLKYIYGKTPGSNDVKKFEYRRIANIKIYKNKKFSPIIPIIPLVS
ncbi:MAG: hypothetical protein GX452_03730 [Ignavibacteriales bacterium]|mgnify:FL=1|jgi:hypothetical protein|nr:hypothetical protein [Ignavibacteriaceae bacterium]NLH60495.1 hypothetical protein [Ignavibacteriales bacterium]HOJ17998.1 hypothetical protein [Ignavibacteriaceae bacterium]HPO54895.1 hypothetical protein [Ignavibacteriaceae bacterium]